MAFDIANRSSLRLNHIIVGQSVTLADFASKKPIFDTAVFNGWTVGNEAIEAPKVIKSAPQGVEMHFTATVPAEEGGKPSELHLTLVKDPAGFGAMFLRTIKVVKEAEGDQPAEYKETLRRVTAYATSEVIEHSRTVRKPVKVEAPEAPTSEAPAATEEAPVEKKASKGKGRKAKAKVEVNEPEVEEVTEG